MQNTNLTEKKKFSFNTNAFLSEYGLYVILAILFIAFTIMSPSFFRAQNFMNILMNVSVVGIIATAMTIAIIGWGPDLSVGSTVAFVGSLQAYLVVSLGLPWYVGIIASLAAGALIGLINGIVSVKFNLAPFIVTLAMMNVVRGLSFVLVDGQSTNMLNSPELTYLGVRKFDLGEVIPALPLCVIVLIISFIVFHIIASKTTFGRHIYACGGNRVAARLAGINTNKIGISLFVMTGFMGAIAGCVMVGLSGFAMPSVGESYALDIITAVILGGTMLSGGKGRVSRTFIGVLIIGILNNGMGLLRFQSFWQTTAKGLFLMLAIILDSLQHKSKN